MNSSSRHRRPHKIRRSGRHAAPSQIQNVADKATKATPAMALAGVLVAAPHAHAAAGAAVKTTTAVMQVHDDAVQSGTRSAGAGTVQVRTDAVAVRAQASAQATRRYTVQRGDTLSSIAQRFYGSAGDWNRLYAANRSVLRNPDMIFPGQVLAIPGHLPVASTSPPGHGGSTQVTTASMLSGTLSCGGLEELWEQAGGSSGDGRHGRFDRHGRIVRPPVRHRRRGGARLLADQPESRLAVHLRSAGQRQGGRHHLRQWPELVAVDHLH